MIHQKRLQKSILLLIACLACTGCIKTSPDKNGHYDHWVKAKDFVPFRQTTLRTPSVPLFTNDPYFSIWSPYDRLNEGSTKHWSDAEKAMDGILRVDGKAYRFMGVQRSHLLQAIAPMSAGEETWTAKVSHQQQKNTQWTKPDFNDSHWASEEAAWGTGGEYPHCRQIWSEENSDIYIRRCIQLDKNDIDKDLWIQFSHDDAFEMYLNGHRIIHTGETWLQGEHYQLTHIDKSYLKAGENIIAAHCHNTYGGAYVDFGLYENILTESNPIEKAVQKSVDVMPTSTYYTFACGGVELDLVFTAPMLMENLELLSTPINYLSYQVRSTDGQAHDIQFYFACSPQLTVNEMTQSTHTSIIKENGISYLKSGSVSQPILERSGDRICIDWGYLYLPDINGQVSLANALTMEEYFCQTGNLPAYEGEIISNDRSSMPVMAYMRHFGKTSQARSFMLIGYDEIKDIRYMNVDYPAYWAREGKSITQAFEEMRDNYRQIMDLCREQDKIIYEDALRAGNEKYAELLSASYRQCLAAHKLFQDNKGNILYFSKENNSNGCVNTVDLSYPSAPLFLLYNTTLLKGMIRSILDYCQSEHWGFADFAAHDLGTYPHANGQAYSITQAQNGSFGSNMPIEESGNILTIIAAIARIEGQCDWLSAEDLKMLKRWAIYLRENGQDPENQLCTDDFAGHWAHNANLSLKAIFGVAAYAEIGRISKQVPKEEWLPFMENARQMAQIWEVDARDGDHYKLAFDRGDTWSIKYNMVWDKLWGLQLLSEDVMRREIKYYKRQQNEFGLPLDKRSSYTKSDWIMWAAAMAPDRESFLEFSDRVWEYAHRTPSRWPLGDWYYTDGQGESCSFRARSVVGGHWMKVLMDKHAPEITKSKQWKAVDRGLQSKFSKDVNAKNPLPEYPRPQFEREKWMNLNGLWQYAVCAKDAECPESFDGRILVPFPIESSLSGVRRQLDADEALWYKRCFTIPSHWRGKNIRLNFGAIDYDATIFVNNKQIGHHIGGYSSFSYDISDALKKGENTLVVKVLDPTDVWKQATGKQRINWENSRTIWYTPCSGIWQTVWLEPVNQKYIQQVHITPELDQKLFHFSIALANAEHGDEIIIRLKDGHEIIKTESLPASTLTKSKIRIDSPKLWSPDSPFLYDVELVYRSKEKEVDLVKSYTAMRKISYARDENGYWRLMLNNKALFQLGTLDQGYWPDGIYTAPTDEALCYDIIKTKEWGFNTIRKHMKVEPDRWFYHCDRLGMLVWQDMPSIQMGGDNGWVDRDWFHEDGYHSDEVETNFLNEWEDIITQHYNAPSVVVWTPFNESWGQFKTAEVVHFTRTHDSTRIINAASGGNHHLDAGDIVDIHTYYDPIINFADPNRPLVLGEYGGLGLNIEGHRWYERFASLYNDNGSVEGLTSRYEYYAKLIDQLSEGLTFEGHKACFSAAIYTQTTDVESEVNGLMTYDREVVKIDEERVKKANRMMIENNSR